MFRHGLLISLAILGATPTARSALVTLSADADNTIFSESLNSGGLATTIFAGRNNAAGVRRALVRFDVAGSVPAGAMITGVTLSLNLDGAAQTENQSRDVGLHRLLADWGEGTSGGGGPGGGQGQPATTGDATWQHTFFDTESWTHAGGDFDPSASSVASIGFVPGPFSWPSTADLVADVQTWLDDPAINFGWAITGGETTNGTVRRFHSREAAMENLRPTLTVEFQAVPEPGSLALLLAAVACAAVCGASRNSRR
jgi:hypothetical protein